VSDCCGSVQRGTRGGRHFKSERGGGLALKKKKTIFRPWGHVRKTGRRNENKDLLEVKRGRIPSKQLQKVGGGKRGSIHCNKKFGE